MAGRTIGAEEALRLGIVNVVVEAPTAWWEDLVEKRLSRTSASSLRFAERAVRAQLMRQLEIDLPELEKLYLDQLMKTHDANEGIHAFIARRRPIYKHQ